MDSLLESSITDHANLEVTSDCNLRCVYCMSLQPTYQRINMDLSYLDHIINALIDRKIAGVTFSGHGETTTVKNWHVYCNKFLEKGIKLHITSNLARELTDEEALTLARFLWVEVSCDTVDLKLFRQLRRGGDFRTLLYNMGKIRAQAYKHSLPEPNFQWSCVVSDKNVFKLEEYVSFGLTLGVKSFHFCNLHTHTDIEVIAKHITEIPRETLGELPDIFHRLSEMITGRGCNYICDPGLSESLQNKLNEINEKDRSCVIKDAKGKSSRHAPGKGLTRDCLDPWNYVFIRANLAVNPCCATTIDLGYLSSRQSLDAILNNTMIKEYRKGLLTGELKKACLNCPTKNWIETDVFNGKVLQFCMRSELHALDRLGINPYKVSCPTAIENLELPQNAKNGNSLNLRSPSRPNPIHLWDDDARFNSILKQITSHTLVDKLRCYMLYQFAKQVLRLPGDVAEIGVYKGGTARLLAKTFEAHKVVHLFDTFSGMPPTDPDRDLHREGDFSDTSLEKVSSFLRDCPNVKFYEGLFPVTAKPIKNKKFCFVHIDVDIYTSVLDCCKFFYPRMVRGGIMVFDDYGFISCPGAKRGVDEFFLRKPETPCYLPTGQCFVVRL